MPIIKCSNQPILQKRNVQLAVEGPFENVKNIIEDRPLLFNFRLTNKQWKQLQMVSGGYRTTPITLAEFDEQEQYIDTKTIKDPDITSGHAVVLFDILYKRVENGYYYYYQLKNSWGCGPGLCDDGIYYIEKALFDKYAIYSIYDVYFNINDLPDVLKASYLNFTEVGGNYEIYQFYAYRFGFGGPNVLNLEEEVAYVIHLKGRIKNLIWNSCRVSIMTPSGPLNTAFMNWLRKRVRKAWNCSIGWPCGAPWAILQPRPCIATITSPSPIRRRV